MGALSMVRGDTKTITVTISNVDAFGNVVLGSNGIQGWLLWMTAKHDYGDGDAAAVFQKLPAAWTITQNGNASTPGIAFVILNPVDTSSLPPYQVTLVYDIQAKDTSNDIFTVDEGTLTVAADVTIATS